MNYFLLDSNVLVAYYCKDEPDAIRKRAREVFAARLKKEAFLYLPNFCVVEVLKAFAKKCYSEHKYGVGNKADDAFEEFRDAFLEDIRHSKIIYSFDLNRRHVLLTDKIIEMAAKMSVREGHPPSAFDVLIVAMGLDLAHVHGHDHLWIVTAEGPLYHLCEADRRQLPRAINIGTHDFPRGIL